MNRGISFSGNWKGPKLLDARVVIVLSPWVT